MADSPHPELRASDADRERVAELLRAAAGDGQLSLDELDERLDATYAARTRGDLVPLTADLQPVDPTAPATAGAVRVRRSPGGARWLVAIMGGCERKGRWRLAERCTVINLMGGSDLDLNQVELDAEHVELRVISIMGGSEIHVPEGLDVEVSEFAFMGGNSVDAGAERTGRPGAPRVHLRLFSLMGGTEVRRGPRLTRAERKALRLPSPPGLHR